MALSVLSALGVTASGLEPEPENSEYGAVLARVGRGVIRRRVGKLTPKKAGLFVTVWRRADDGSTTPFADDGSVDLLVVDVREGGLAVVLRVVVNSVA